jgi:hypothetical protein
MSSRQLYPLSGTLFIVIALLSVAIAGSTPDENASATKVVSSYDGNNTRQAIAGFVLAASIPFLIVFGSYLASLSRDRDDHGIWRTMLIAGVTLEGAALAASAALHVALTNAIHHGVTGDAARILNILDSDSWVAWNTGLGVLMIGIGATVFAAAFLPRWMGWTSLIAGVLLFIPYADFFALVASLLLIIAVSIYLAATNIQRQRVVTTAA